MPGAIYPLSLDQRLLQRDMFYQDRAALSQSLDQIRTNCNTRCSTPLSECSEHLSATIEAYHAYYLHPGPGRWHSDLHAYRSELQSMFDTSPSFTMSDIQARAAQEFRQFIKQDLCTPDPSEPPVISSIKITVTHMLEDGLPVEDCIDQYRNILAQNSPNEETARFLYDLQAATTAEERAQLYIRHYCTPLPTDSSKVANFKAKYARQFQSGASHDTVLAAMKSEAQSSASTNISGLQTKLGELQMAQSAHLKSLARKAERDQRMREVATSEAEKEVVECGMAGCEEQVEVEPETDLGGSVECALCDWMSQKVEQWRRTFYCSKEHAEADFASHDRQQHTCISGSSCYYFPFPPPQSGTAAGGVCPDCLAQKRISYFCSQLCFRKNVSAHRASAGCGDGFDYRASLEMFEPSPEMVLEA